MLMGLMPFFSFGVRGFGPLAASWARRRFILAPHFSNFSRRPDLALNSHRFSRPHLSLFSSTLRDWFTRASRGRE